MERYLGSDFEFNDYNNSSIYLDIYDEYIESHQTENIIDALKLDIKNKLIDVKGLYICLDYPKITEESNAQLPHPKIIIPEHIKYLVLDCPARYYTNLFLPSDLEYIKLYITTSMICDNILEYIKLPITVKSLTILLSNDLVHDIDDTILSHLTPRTRNVKISTDEKNLMIAFNKLNKFIPKIVEYLEINFNISDYGSYKSLKTLIIRSEPRDFYPELQPLDNLPESLQWLDIHHPDFNHALNNLPSNLKFLRVGQGRISTFTRCYKYNLDMLPISLEVLFFPENDKHYSYVDGYNYDYSLDNLPTNLKILNIPEYIYEGTNFNNLPDSIEILEWSEFDKYHKYITRFPKNLKEIQVSRWGDAVKNMQEIYKDAPFIIRKLQYPQLFKDDYELQDS
jgi:hypothetical protein